MSELPGQPPLERADESARAGPTEAVTSAASARSAASAIWEQLRTILVAILIALGIRSLVIEPFRIPSESMLPTLLIGDHLFVNKFVYGAKLPFTDLRLPAVRAPRRGDVVVFTVGREGRRYFPIDQRPELPSDRFVKRIVGLPGETLEVRGSRLYVDSELIESWDVGDTFQDKSGRELTLRRELLDGREHALLDDPRKAGPEVLPTRVPEGRYFVMGDNRDDSNDSRIWGTVRLEDLKGPAFVLYWSWDWQGSWQELMSPVTWWTLFTERMRWGRVGAAIE